MKKSEIINYLNERKCQVRDYSRQGNELCINVKYVSSNNIEDLSKKGMLIFISANGSHIFLEIIGNIEWD